MTADEAARELMQLFDEFAVRRTAQGYELILFQETGKRRTAHYTSPGTGEEVELSLPVYREVIIARAPTFTGLLPEVKTP